jgi:Fe-S-cluster-containing dehydrogenase component
MAENTILVNLQRCTGCWTCSLACKVGNSLADEDFWLTIRTLGSGEGIDRPAGRWPHLHMSWMPLWSPSCVKCVARTSSGKLPYCVNSCPNSALSFGEAVPGRLNDLKTAGFRLFTLPSWENSKDNVIYASKD